MGMKDALERLAALKAKKAEMGGAQRVERQHGRGKLDARQRLELLFDPGSVQELGMLASAEGRLAEEEDPGRPTAADGVLTAFGTIEGRPVAAAIYDFTVLGGSIGEVGERKVTRLRDLALKSRTPIVWLVDSGGARLEAGGEVDPRRLAGFADTGYLFREQSVLSGVVPQVSAMLGPGAAGTAYIPGLADYVPMVKDIGSIAVGGPALVKSTVGEDVTEQQLGGSKLHNEVSGVADGEFADDAACIAAVREYLGFFPSHCGEKPPRRPTSDPVDRRDESLLTVVPDNPRQAFDMHKVIVAIADDRKFFPLKPRFARNLITGLCRIDGWSVGVVASNSMFLGGVLDVAASDKAARFVALCDAFQIPLLFLQDVPGFMVGTKAEQSGLIRHGARMLQMVSSATVPKLTVVVRKGFGAGYYVMNGRAYEPDLLLAWPDAEIGIMGAEGLVSIGAKKLLEQAESTEAAKTMKEELAAGLRPHVRIDRAAALGMVDDVIDPRDTRKALAMALQRTASKQVERPWRRREVPPV
ncbi:MAG TPA: acyl-CoA carboxylase subunit beta [Myxococcaceae bacterium]|nr:acyl-CoA carboxylase subunit beta [Myxococcaceae bacterium]